MYTTPLTIHRDIGERNCASQYIVDMAAVVGCVRGNCFVYFEDALHCQCLGIGDSGDSEGPPIIHYSAGQGELCL